VLVTVVEVVTVAEAVTVLVVVAETTLVVVVVVDTTVVAVEVTTGVVVVETVVVTGHGVNVFLKKEEQSAEPLAGPGECELATT